MTISRENPTLFLFYCFDLYVNIDYTIQNLQKMKTHYRSTFLLIGLALFLISCSKESIVEPSDPIESLKEWFSLNSTIQGQENIIWGKAKPVKLNDSSVAFAFPVISKVGVKELIIYDRNGKRNAVFKQYIPKGNNQEMNGFSINGDLVKAITIRKDSNLVIKKSKLSSIKFLNSELPVDDPNYIWDLGMAFSFYFVYSRGGATYYVSNSGQGSSYFNIIYNDYLSSGTGGNFDSYYEYNNFNYSQIDAKLTNQCFISVLSELQNNNIYGAISDIIESLYQTKNGQKYNFTIREMSTIEEQEYSADNAFVSLKNEICLNTTKLKNTSKEYIARVILHEFLHLYINKSNDLDHIEIATKYVTPMANFLKKLYSTDYEDAISLSLLGLQSVPNYTILLEHFNKTTTMIYDVKIKYTKNGYGKYCN